MRAGWAMIAAHRTNPHARPVVDWIAVVAAGMALGIGTQILQGLLPDSWGVLANSTAAWAVAAFALGAHMSNVRAAAIGGAMQLVIASCAFYMAVDWFEGSSSGPKGAIVWSCAGIIAGPIFGAAGFRARHSLAWRRPAFALVAGTIAGEAVHVTWFTGNAALRPAGAAELVIATMIAGWCLIAPNRRTIVTGIVLSAGAATLLAGNIIGLAFGA